MKFVFAADIHGNMSQYQKIFDYLKQKNIPLLVLGGDLTPKNQELRNPLAQKEFLHNSLFPLIQEYLGRVLIIMGNDDYRRNLKFLEDNQSVIGYKLIYSPCLIDGFYFAGYSYVPYTPFKWKDWERRDLSSDEETNLRYDVATKGFIDYDKPYDIMSDFKSHSIEQDLTDLLKNVPAEKLIFVTHAPPADTAADFTKDNEGNLRHVGSYAVYKIIREKQPLISLHGHIHDTVQNSGIFPEKIGRTICCAVSNDHIGEHPYIVEVDTSHGIMVERKNL